jgi:hypothetical protein
MRLQCTALVIVTFVARKLGLFTSFQHVPNATHKAAAPDSNPVALIEHYSAVRAAIAIGWG